MKTSVPLTSLHRTRGFSLVELSVALAILGLLAMGSVAYWRSASQQATTAKEVEVLTRVQQAMLGFMHANFRLPCPATDATGNENCSAASLANQVGKLPWRTLQLPDESVAAYKYGVYRDPNASAVLDADMAVSKDRLAPLLAVGVTPVAADVFLGQSNLADYCYALSRAEQSTLGGARLSVRYSESGLSVVRPVAYAVAAPGLLDSDGDGDPFDGENRKASNSYTVFDAGNRSVDASYDDRVMASSFLTLYTQLDCGAALSAVHRSHFNSALSAALMRRAMMDYHRQTEIAAIMAGAGLAQAIAGVSGATASLSKAIATTANATTFTVISVGTASGLLTAAAASMVVSTAAVVASAPVLAKAIATQAVSIIRVARAAEFVTNSDAMATSIESNARNADALGH